MTNEDDFNLLIQALPNILDTISFFTPETQRKMSEETSDMYKFLAEHLETEEHFQKFFELFCNPHCYYSLKGEYYPLFDKMLAVAEKMGEPEKLFQMYRSLGFMFDKQRSMAILEDGVQKFLSLNENHFAGKICILISSRSESDKEKRTYYCDQALELFDKSTVEYAEALTRQKYMHLTNPKETDRFQHFNIFCTKAMRENQTISLSTYGVGTHCKVSYPDWAFVPVLSVYNAPWDGEQGFIIPDDKVDIRGVRYEFPKWTIENYFEKNIGLTRCNVKKDDKTLWTFELFDHEIKGGEGLLPLCIGNKWSYKLQSCDDWAEHVIEREVISAGKDCFYISCANYIMKQQ